MTNATKDEAKNGKQVWHKFVCFFRVCPSTCGAFICGWYGADRYNLVYPNVSLSFNLFAWE